LVLAVIRHRNDLPQAVPGCDVANLANGAHEFNSFTRFSLTSRVGLHVNQFRSRGFLDLFGSQRHAQGVAAAKAKAIGQIVLATHVHTNHANQIAKITHLSSQQISDILGFDGAR
jgi:hypothetical protein